MAFKASVKRLCLGLAVLAYMGIGAEANIFGYFKGICDDVCKQCKYDCEAKYKAGTFKRWMCKGNCKLLTKK
ncbi:putative integral membrane protein [Babesia bovis T2Bo]|uniref:putative integral membrane protein n=1 Tax=Babesia bovis T2Bo TaxID=484906 RepID=UPI001C353A3C|nr:putative integral membrane protein [Babesia bovis T2Bo]KAG6440097.1 putative integral membrane protein [Babesia bovis T2Bo]